MPLAVQFANLIPVHHQTLGGGQCRNLQPAFDAADQIVLSRARLAGARLRGAEVGAPPQAADRPGPAFVAVVVHMYYEDTWPDIAGALRGLTVPFDLIVTTVAGRERLIETIRQAYPRAEIEVVENRGRDVGPFLALLERGRLDRYKYICKVHSKKSIDARRKTYMGAMWRRRLLFDLLGAPGAASAAIDMFERDPSIGMIGPRVFRLPKPNYPEDLSWSANRAMTLKIAERMGIPPHRFKLDFFGGTMFWVRPEALRPLRDLRLAAEMPYERGLIDGDLPHALERALPTSVDGALFGSHSSIMRIAGCPPIDRGLPGSY